MPTPMTEKEIRDHALRMSDREGSHVVMSIQPEEENRILFVVRDPMVFWGTFRSGPLRFQKQEAEYVATKLNALYPKDSHYAVLFEDLKSNPEPLTFQSSLPVVILKGEDNEQHS